MTSSVFSACKNDFHFLFFSFYKESNIYSFYYSLKVVESAIIGSVDELIICI